MQRQVFNCVFWGWLLILLLAKSDALASQAPVFSSQKASVRNYLNPHTGRFWSMDSYEGSYLDPGSLHKYLYCHGSPLNRCDPSGHFDSISTTFTLGTIGILAATTMAAVAIAKSHAYIDLGHIVGGIPIGALGEDISSAVNAAQIEAMKGILAAAGTSVATLISTARKQINQPLARVVPIPARIMPAVAAHIQSVQSTNPDWIKLTRVGPVRAVENRLNVLRNHAAAGWVSAASAAALGWQPNANGVYGAAAATVGVLGSLDEYPFASSLEGGSSSTSVAVVGLKENCLQGAIIGLCYKTEPIDIGADFQVVVVP